MNQARIVICDTQTINYLVQCLDAVTIEGRHAHIHVVIKKLLLNSPVCSDNQIQTIQEIVLSMNPIVENMNETAQ